MLFYLPGLEPYLLHTLSVHSRLNLSCVIQSIVPSTIIVEIVCLQDAAVCVQDVSVTSGHMPVHFFCLSDLICCACILQIAGQGLGAETEFERVLQQLRRCEFSCSISADSTAITTALHHQHLTLSPRSLPEPLTMCNQCESWCIARAGSQQIKDAEYKQ